MTDTTDAERDVWRAEAKARRQARFLFIATGFFTGQLILKTSGKTPADTVKKAREYAEALAAEFPDVADDL